MYVGYTADIFRPGFPCRTFWHVGTLWYEIHSDADADAIRAAGFYIQRVEK